MNGHLVFRTVVLLFLTFEEISPTCLTNPSITGGHLGTFQSNSFVLVPSLNFTCSGNTTSLRWEVTQLTGNPNTPRRIELYIWRQTKSMGNNIDYTRVYNEMVTVTESTTLTNIFTITPTVATTYESGDIVGFYIPGSGATGVVEFPFGTAEGHSYYYVTASSPSSEEKLNTQNIVSRTRAPFLQISAIPTSSEEMLLSVTSVLSTSSKADAEPSENAMITKSTMQMVLITSSMTSAIVTQTNGPSTVNSSSSSDTETVSTSKISKLSTDTSTGEYSSTLSYMSPPNGLSSSSPPIDNSTSPTVTTEGTVGSRSSLAGTDSSGSPKTNANTVSTTKISKLSTSMATTSSSYTSPPNNLSSTAATDGAIAPHDRTAAITGGVVAAIILLVVVGVIVVIVVCMCRRRRNKEKYYIEENYDIPFNTLYYNAPAGVVDTVEKSKLTSEGGHTEYEEPHIGKHVTVKSNIYNKSEEYPPTSTTPTLAEQWEEYEEPAKGDTLVSQYEVPAIGDTLVSQYEEPAKGDTLVSQYEEPHGKSSSNQTERVSTTLLPPTYETSEDMLGSDSSGAYRQLQPVTDELSDHVYHEADDLDSSDPPPQENVSKQDAPFPVYGYVPTMRERRRMAELSSNNSDTTDTQNHRQTTKSLSSTVKTVEFGTGAGALESGYEMESTTESDIYCVPCDTEEEIYTQLARYKILEILSSHIKIGKKLGEGQFGEVYRASWRAPNDSPRDVAVKTVKKGAPKEEKLKLLQEAVIVGQFKHRHVVGLIGVVTLEQPKMIIMELLPKGDLLEHLHEIKSTPSLLKDPNLPSLLLQFCKQVVDGLACLALKSFVHRDIAARNVLLDSNLNCKISDFGMSRDLDTSDYYVTHGGKIPVKWTAPEAILYKKYSTASDVWSYGMLMYEIWSLGHKPFEELTVNQVVKIFDKGYCHPCPPGCPKPVYQIMVECWHPDSHKRPTADDINGRFCVSERTLLSWSEEEKKSSKFASVLGASLEEGKHLFEELQFIYKT